MRCRRLILLLLLLSAAMPAGAQQAVAPPDAATMRLLEDWQVYQVAMRRVAEGMQALVIRNQQEVSQTAAERKYWAEYVAGLKPAK